MSGLVLVGKPTIEVFQTQCDITILMMQQSSLDTQEKGNEALVTSKFF